MRPVMLYDWLSPKRWQEQRQSQGTAWPEAESRGRGSAGCSSVASSRSSSACSPARCVGHLRIQLWVCTLTSTSGFCLPPTVIQTHLTNQISLQE